MAEPHHTPTTDTPGSRSPLRRLARALALILGVLLLAVVLLVVFLTVTEYRPEDRQPADRLVLQGDPEPVGPDLTLYAWNLGYAGLGEASDFFMDGGEMSVPPSQETVEANLQGITAFIQSTPADIWFLQEVDLNSARSGSTDQFSRLLEATGHSGAFAYNYKCPFVPIPLPPMGRIESGLATLSAPGMQPDAERISLPCPFQWPVRAANLKRCLLVTRMEVAGSDRELVLVNLHLEAYESGEGRIAQTRELLAFMEEEYARGNYVIAGGDFNQSFPGTLETFPIQDPEGWVPGLLREDTLPAHWQMVWDGEEGTCRLLDRPYDQDSQLYVIDGFFLSPNIRVERVETVPLDFRFADHNPVALEVTLLP